MRVQAFSRRCVLAAAMLTSFAGAASAQAPAFPSRPIHLVIPAPPGGSTDTLGRILAKVLQDQVNVPVVVDNRPGAAGSIGVLATVNAVPDGYTILLSVPDAVVVYPLLNKKATYRFDRNLTPITLVAKTHMMFAVNGKSPVKTIADLAALSKAEPGKLTYSTPGGGTSGHLSMEYMKYKAGIDMLHVPYKGAGPAMLAVVSGETTITATSPASLRPFIASGQLRAIAVAKETRTEILPQVPTTAESGYPDFIIPAWFGVFAPAGVKPDIAAKLNDMMLAATRSPEFAKQATTLGLEVEPASLGDFGKQIARESDTWRQLITTANITMDE